MKTLYKFFYNFLIIFIVSNMMILDDVIAQDFHQNQPQYESMYMKNLDYFLQKSNPVYIASINQKEIRTDYLFLLDTTYVYTVSNNPTRYSYSYSDNHLLTSKISEVIVNNSWVFSTYQANTYDDNGNIATTLWRTWDNGSFTNVAKDSYEYDFNGNITSSLHEMWANGSWENNNRSTYIFNVGGNLVSHLNVTWDGSTWVNNTFELYTYDDLGNLLTAVGSLWVDGVWVTDTQNIYSYDDNNNMIEAITEIWINDEWQNYFHQNFTYDAANNRLSAISQFWDSTAWVNSNNDAYVYDNLGFLSSDISQSWQDSIWVNQHKETFVYNYFGGFETVLNQVWDTTNWVNLTMALNNYDEFGNTIDAQYFNWVDDTWGHTIDGVLRLFYDYSTKTELTVGYLADAQYTSVQVGVNESFNVSTVGLSCKPNPAASSTIISVDVATEANVSVRLLNNMGSTIKNVYTGQLTKGSHNFNINVSSLAAGNYYVVFATDNEKKSAKLIITK